MGVRFEIGGYFDELSPSSSTCVPFPPFEPASRVGRLKVKRIPSGSMTCWAERRRDPSCRCFPTTGRGPTGIGFRMRRGRTLRHFLWRHRGLMRFHGESGFRSTSPNLVRWCEKSYLPEQHEAGLRKDSAGCRPMLHLHDDAVACGDPPPARRRHSSLVSFLTSMLTCKSRHEGCGVGASAEFGARTDGGWHGDRMGSTSLGGRIPERCNQTKAFRAYLGDDTMPMAEGLLAGASDEEARLAAEHVHACQGTLDQKDRQDFSPTMSTASFSGMLVILIHFPGTQHSDHTTCCRDRCPRTSGRRRLGHRSRNDQNSGGHDEGSAGVLATIGTAVAASTLVRAARLWKRYLIGNPLFVWRVLTAAIKLA